jgi:thiol-disulfide isomerase/thioredoxin
MTASSRALIWALVVVFAGSGGYFAYKFSERSRGGLRPDTSEKLVMKEENSSFDNETEMLEPPKMRPIPEKLPDLTLVDLQGHTQKLSSWPGRPLMVNFWATWCEPCRREIPLLIELRKQYAHEGLEVVGIAVDFPDAVRKYATKMGIDYPVLIGEQEGLDAIAAFGMQPIFPFSVFADRQTRIVAIRVGELHADEADFILGEVKAIDQGQRTLAEAKQRISDQLRNLAVEHATAANQGDNHDHEHDRDD